MNVALDNTAIVVIDVASQETSYRYLDESKTNDFFVQYLNNKLIDIKHTTPVKLIEINYKTAPNKLLTVNMDISTTNKPELFDFFNTHDIKHVIYVGFHYRICTHYGRELSPMKIQDELPHIYFYVCPMFCRPVHEHMWETPGQFVFDIPHINL